MSTICLVCGQPTQLIPDYQRIIGGSEAPQHTIPWQVMLSVHGNRAGGMVIADRWILTAAHVLDSRGIRATKENIRVRKYNCLGVRCAPLCVLK